MKALRFSHPSLPPTIPFQHSIFQNCNLWSPAVQGAPECIYSEMHFITRSHIAAKFTLSKLQPSCLWPWFFLHWCNPALLLHPSSSPASAILEKEEWTVNGKQQCPLVPLGVLTSHLPVNNTASKSSLFLFLQSNDCWSFFLQPPCWSVDTTLNYLPRVWPCDSISWDCRGAEWWAASFPTKL